MAGRLTRLSGMRGFTVADGEPDIRGWEVRTLSGAEVGEVDDLFVDPHRGEVVLIDIDMKGSDQHVNVPIRGVQIDRSRRCVIVDSGDIRAARESGLDYDRDRMIAEDRGPDRDRDRIIDRDRDNDGVDDDREVRTRDRDIADDTEEVVVERRPVIEEVVVRRRVVDSDDVVDEDR